MGPTNLQTILSNSYKDLKIVKVVVNKFKLSPVIFEVIFFITESIKETIIL